MDDSQKTVVRAQLQTVIPRLERNGMTATYVDNAAEALAHLKGLLREGETVANGGSATLQQMGALDWLRSGPYRFLDRTTATTPEETRQIYLESFAADTYLCSCNAVTMNGELFNVDGNSNRVAAICYGPRRVIMVVGCNKLVRDVDAAIARLKTCAAPPNAVRLHCETPCAATGSCVGLNGGMTAGCTGDDRICCNYVISARQRQVGRIHLILVGEPLGF